MTERGTEKDSRKMGRKIGVLGGTFDPVHHAHLRMAEEAYERLDLSEVLLVLSATPPHKETEGISPFEIRWKMLQAVCEKNPRLTAIDLEANRGGPSYTIDTLQTIQDLYGPKTELFLLVGMDHAVEFRTWKSHEKILEQAELIVFGRPGENPDRIDPALRERMSLLEWSEFSISSTQIRRKISEGKSVRYLVPPEVLEAIEEKGLYRTGRISPGPTSGKSATDEVFA